MEENSEKSKNSAKKTNKITSERVREFMAERELKQGKFAEVIGVSPEYVSMIARGARPLSLKLAEKIAKEYEGVYVPYLLGLTDAKDQTEDRVKQLGFALADCLVHHRIVAMKNYLEALGYHFERNQDHLSFKLYSPENIFLCCFTDSDFDNLSADIYDFVKMKILKMQGRF